jgi:hypothetical protein
MFTHVYDFDFKASYLCTGPRLDHHLNLAKALAWSTLLLAPPTALEPAAYLLITAALAAFNSSPSNPHPAKAFNSSANVVIDTTPFCQLNGKFVKQKDVAFFSLYIATLVEGVSGVRPLSGGSLGGVKINYLNK